MQIQILDLLLLQRAQIMEHLIIHKPILVMGIKLIILLPRPDETPAQHSTDNLTVWAGTHNTQTSFIIIDNKGRLPASGKGAWHPELHVDANSLSLSLLSVMGEYFNSFSYFHLFAGHR